MAQLLGSSRVVLQRMFFGFREIAKEIMTVSKNYLSPPQVLLDLNNASSQVRVLPAMRDWTWYEALSTRASIQHVMNQSQQQQGAKRVNFRLLRALQGTETSFMHVQSS